MDANIILGSAILVVALVSGVFLASMVLAASQESEARAGRPLYGRRTRGALARPGTGPPVVSHAELLLRLHERLSLEFRLGRLVQRGVQCERTVGKRLDPRQKPPDMRRDDLEGTHFGAERDRAVFQRSKRSVTRGERGSRQWVTRISRAGILPVHRGVRQDAGTTDSFWNGRP